MKKSVLQKNKMAQNKGFMEFAFESFKKDIQKPLRNQIDHLEKSFEWISSIYYRDNLVCQICGVKCRRKKLFTEDEKTLPIANADHIKPVSSLIKELNITQAIQALVCPEFWDTENGRTLCVSCHKKTPSYGINYFPKLSKA